MIRRTAVGELDIEDPTDYMDSRGRLVVFTVGPLCVWWNGADGPTFGFTWTFLRWQWGVTLGDQAQKRKPDPLWDGLPIPGLREQREARTYVATSADFSRKLGSPWDEPWPSRDIIERASDS